MLVIRMQRTGRKGHAQFRVVVQDSRRTPTSGKLVAALGHFNPHTKEAVLDKDKASFYLEHGAQPSERVARLLKSQGIKLPKWVSLESKKKRSVKNPEKLRKNRPAEPAQTSEAEVSADKPEAKAEEPSEETVEEKPVGTEAPAETTTEPVAPGEAAEDKPTESAEQKIAEEAPAEKTEDKS